MGRSNALFNGAGRRLGWSGSSVDALSAVFVFDGHQQNGDDPGRGRASEAWAAGGVLLHQAVQRVLFGAVALVVDRGAIRRPLGLPADGLHAMFPRL